MFLKVDFELMLSSDLVSADSGTEYRLLESDILSFGD